MWNTGNTYLVREVPGGRAPRVGRASRYGAFVSWSAERYRDGTFTF